MDEVTECLEAAASPSRDLDHMIAQAIGLQTPDEPPAFTSSLDAALTLVPDGWQWTMHCEYPPTRVEMGDPALCIEGEHEHHAIALCIAALKAQYHALQASYAD